MEIIKINEVAEGEIKNAVMALTPKQLNTNLIYNSLNFKELAKQINVSVTTVRQVLYENEAYNNKREMVLDHLRQSLIIELKRRKNLYVQ